MEFEYIIENGEVTITCVEDKFIKSIEIPEFIDGLPVTTIGHKAFYDCSSLSMIIIPTTINKIFYSIIFHRKMFKALTLLVILQLPLSRKLIKTFKTTFSLMLTFILVMTRSVTFS